ncbi:glycosyltransferase family 2 protein [Butyrivibrio sp. AD3002]|uniref:glycosyltransferase family 2 protein n=1 Tax=Butyrivibrio sp. AD3002 TaxID=1280670 RepID=UPI0003B4F9B3|nr:glycosyltransferase family 2 protein [Butyrivibrio sp. AD3002]
MQISRISVITVCYNSEKTIRRTIESVLNQTEAPFEHIFVDGASCDNTVKTIEEYKSQYEERNILLRVISEPDEGYYDAMNKGVHTANGDIIGILNSDDYYEKNALEILRKYTTANSEADIFMGAIYIHNGQQIIRKQAKNTKYYQTSRHFNHPAMFAKIGAYRDVGDYVNGNVHNDYGWYLKALKMEKKVCIIPDVLTNFTIGGESSRKSFKNTIKRIKLKYQTYRENGYSALYIIECVGQELVKYLLLKR